MGKAIVAMTLAVFVLAGCDTPGQTVGLGAGLGAGAAAITGSNIAVGAALGAGAGAICEVADGCN